MAWSPPWKLSDEYTTGFANQPAPQRDNKFVSRYRYACGFGPVLTMRKRYAAASAPPSSCTLPMPSTPTAPLHFPRCTGRSSREARTGRWSGRSSSRSSRTREGSDKSYVPGSPLPKPPPVNLGGESAHASQTGSQRMAALTRRAVKSVWREPRTDGRKRCETTFAWLFTGCGLSTACACARALTAPPL